MKLFATASLALLGLIIPSSLSSPFVKREKPFNPPGISRNNNTLVERNSGSNTCSASYIKAAETRAKKECQTISTLCSSLQGKYKTVTHTIYTKTTTPKTTIGAATTAPRPIVTATSTAEITQQSTDVEGSTSVTDVTNVYTHTTVVETDTVTVTQPVPIGRRNQSPCQQIESILKLPVGSATPFCSCYISGTTSTKTVTCDGVTTARPVSVTRFTTTVTPAASTTFTTVFQTTTIITTVQSGTVITSRGSADATISVTDVVTTTVAPAPAASSYLQIKNPGSPYNNYYAFIDLTETDFAGHPLEFTPDVAMAQTFSVDSSQHLNSASYTAEQNPQNDSDDPDSNTFFLADATEVAGAVSDGIFVQPTCSVAPLTGLLSCSSPNDRVTLSICPSTATFFGSIYVDAPFAVLDTTIDTGCELAVLQFTPAS